MCNTGDIGNATNMSNLGYTGTNGNIDIGLVLYSILGALGEQDLGGPEQPCNAYCLLLHTETLLGRRPSICT